MLLEELRIAVELVEVLNDARVARPHVHIVVRVPQMVCQAAPKVSSTEDDYSGFIWGKGHGRF